jgi:N-acetyl-gamma-glutamylphosphate reductase
MLPENAPHRIPTAFRTAPEDQSGQHFVAAPGLFPPGETLNVKPVSQTVLVGVNYKFNWDSPAVVAKY